MDFHYFQCRTCFTSLPGGNLVDGLPPVALFLLPESNTGEGRICSAPHPNKSLGATRFFATCSGVFCRNELSSKDMIDMITSYRMMCLSCPWLHFTKSYASAKVHLGDPEF